MSPPPMRIREVAKYWRTRRPRLRPRKSLTRGSSKSFCRAPIATQVIGLSDPALIPADEFSGQRGVSCDHQPGPNEPIRPENYESQLLPDRHQPVKSVENLLSEKGFCQMTLARAFAATQKKI